MTVEDDIVHEVQQSLSRCTIHGKFFDRFCANFKAAHIPIPPLAGRQQKFLKEDLARLVMCAGDANLAHQGGIGQLNVPPQLSKFWIDALLATVRECDEKFTPELERKWRIVLTKGMAAAGKARLPA
ncbi:hypothetical protein [Oligoflexus tunisiensis]|uniref:hypothetical protein n=1 Tax=Oligoflexus tunisiensis TaxID=708132 RepID=UPI00114CC58E|nr:hypothetical protein [Oligoflexus tunisiensis]